MSEKTIAALIEQISSAHDWWDRPGGDMLQAANSADVRMGAYAHPLDPDVDGLSWSQWQFERAKRMVLAALNEALRNPAQ